MSDQSQIPPSGSAALSADELAAETAQQAAARAQRHADDARRSILLAYERVELVANARETIEPHLSNIDTVAEKADALQAAADNIDAIYAAPGAAASAAADRATVVTKAAEVASNTISVASNKSTTELLTAQATTARDAALAAGGTKYPDTTDGHTAGRLSVTDGFAYLVQGSGDVAVRVFRRVNATTSLELPPVPSAAPVIASKQRLNDDELKSKRPITLKRGFGKPDYRGPATSVGGTVKISYGSDQNYDNKFVGLNIEARTAERWPAIPAKDMSGRRHLLVNERNQIVGYKDANNRSMRWDGRHYVPEVEIPTSPSGVMRARQATNLVIKETARFLAAQNVSSTVAVQADPPEAHGPQQIITSNFAPWAYVSRQIAVGTQIGSRKFRACYGRNNIAPGESGEVAPCYVTVYYSDDNWATENVALVVAPDNTGRVAPNLIGVGDQHIHATYDGQIVLTYLVQGSGKRRTNRGLVITNPLTGTSGTFTVGPSCFLGWGFGGKMMEDGTALYHTCSEPIFGLTDLQKAESWRGCKLQEIRRYGTTLISSFISRIPEPVGMEDFAEASLARFQYDGMAVLFRTTGRQHIARSWGDWQTWDVREFTAYGSNSARACLLPLPHYNRVALLLNPTTLGRRQLGVTVTPEDPDMLQWGPLQIYEPRGNSPPRVSYPDGYLIRDAYGQLADKFGDVHDCGRNAAPEDYDPLTDTYRGSLVSVEINIPAAIAGDPFTGTRIDSPTHP